MRCTGLNERETDELLLGALTSGESQCGYAAAIPSPATFQTVGRTAF